VQLRYEKALLSVELLARVPREQLAGSEAMFCFVSSKREIVSCRFLTIIRAEFIGTSVIFTVAANAFANGIEDSAIRAATSTTDRLRLPAPPSARTGELFGLGATTCWSRQRTYAIDAFEQTAKRLVEDPAFSGAGTAFFHIVGLKKAAGRSWFGTWPRSEPVREGAFLLATGKRYQCEVYCLHLHETNPAAIGPPQPIPALAIEGSDDWFQFGSSKRQAIDTRYDLKRFIFSTESNAWRRVGGLSVFLTKGLDPKHADYRQDILLPMIFSGSWGWYSLRVLAVAVATSGPSLTAINAAGKLDNLGIVLFVLALGLVAGIAAVVPGFKVKA